MRTVAHVQWDCDRCGRATSQPWVEGMPEGWTFEVRGKDTLHFCPACTAVVLFKPQAVKP